MRRATVEDLTSREFDLIVIGGGITGASAAHDAALRGYSVLLLEKDDFASGTSSRSSKLIHGGLRYLQTFQFGLVAESVRERERTLTLAPHRSHLRPFMYLLYRGDPEGPALLNLGLTFYDVVSGSWRKRRHRMLDAREVLEREPHLAADGLRGAGLYVDVLTDDARLTLDTVKGAAEAGAVVLNHAAVVGLIDEGGRCRGVVATMDGLGRFPVRARAVLNATGVWSDDVRGLAGPVTTTLRPTKGTHIVLSKADFPLGTAVFLRSPDDGRVVWPTPALDEDLVYIGTTDTDYAGDPDDVAPDEADIEYLLRVANRTIPSAQVTADHIVGSWAGLRPLVAPPSSRSASATSREHHVAIDDNGLISITGGKLTSGRVMARDLIDTAARAAGLPATPSVIASTPLPGSLAEVTERTRRRAIASGVPETMARAWAARYGSDSERLLGYWIASDEHRRSLGPRELSVAEVAYLVDHEAVRTLEDLLVRRISAFFWERDGGLRNVDAIADVLAERVPWTFERREAEIASYRTLVARHRPGLGDR